MVACGLRNACLPDHGVTLDTEAWQEVLESLRREGHALVTGLDVIELEGTPLIVHRERLCSALEAEARDKFQTTTFVDVSPRLATPEGCESVPPEVMVALLEVEAAFKKGHRHVRVGEAMAPAVAGILLGYPVTYVLRGDGPVVGNCLGCQPLLRYEVTARLSRTAATRLFGEAEGGEQERHMVFAFTVPAVTAGTVAAQHNIERSHHSMRARASAAIGEGSGMPQLHIAAAECDRVWEDVEFRSEETAYPSLSL